MSACTTVLLRIDSQDYPVLNEKNPARLPWRQMGVDLVFECTGVFRKREDLVKHIEAGARFVILSAPAKSDDVPTLIHAVNTAGNVPPQIISCASCTTNCITPVVEIMGRRIGIKKATMTTIPCLYLHSIDHRFRAARISGAAGQALPTLCRLPPGRPRNHPRTTSVQGEVRWRSGARPRAGWISGRYRVCHRPWDFGCGGQWFFQRGGRQRTLP